MSTVFLGTSEFAAAVLTRLAGSDAHRPALVLTRPDRPRGRGRRLAPPPVADRARELGIPLAQPAGVNDPEARELIARAGGPDAAGDGGEGGRQTVIVCAFGALIKEPLLSEHDILNVHPSLLPRWRGAAPIERALMAGDEQTGVSIMRLTEGLDSGPVCLAAGEPIRRDDSYGSLAPRLSDIGGELLVRALAERPPFVAQPERGVTYAEKIDPEDRMIDPARPAAELERLVRALHPHIGARLKLADGTLLGVHRAALVEPGPHGNLASGGDPASDGAPASGGDPASGGAPASGAPPSGARASDQMLGAGLVAREGRLLLDCADGLLELVEVQPAGGRAMDAASYLRGHAPGRA